MIRHFLKNGTEVPDITGHVVRREDVPILYQMLERGIHGLDKHRRAETGSGAGRREDSRNPEDPAEILR